MQQLCCFGYIPLANWAINIQLSEFRTVIECNNEGLGRDILIQEPSVDCRVKPWGNLQYHLERWYQANK